MNLFDPLIPYTAFLLPDPLYPPTITDPLPPTLFLYQVPQYTYPRSFLSTPINKGPNEIQALRAIEANYTLPIPTNHSTDINPPIESDSLSLKIGPIGNRYLPINHLPRDNWALPSNEPINNPIYNRPSYRPTLPTIPHILKWNFSKLGFWCFWKSGIWNFSKLEFRIILNEKFLSKVKKSLEYQK